MVKASNKAQQRRVLPRSSTPFSDRGMKFVNFSIDSMQACEDIPINTN
jgi:hypothetical protein